MSDTIITSCVCAVPASGSTYVGDKDDRIVVKCLNCGLMRTLERPVSYQVQYEDGSYHNSAGVRQNQEPYLQRFRHDVAVGAKRVRKLVNFTRVLDVGCANGGFMQAAVQAGFTVEGLELNPELARWAADMTGCRVHTSWDTVEGPFDVVTYHDVIEHVTDPVRELSGAWLQLRPGGMLILDTPDAGHEAFAADPMASHHMKPREHLWFFDEENLRRLLAETFFHLHRVDRPIPGKIVVYAVRL